MSNSVMNFHYEVGQPCGDHAGVIEIADWAGDLLLTIAAIANHNGGDDAAAIAKIRQLVLPTATDD